MQRLLIIGLAVLLFSSLGLSGQTKANYHLSLIHVNDTHSKFEPSLTKLTFDIDSKLKAKPVYLELGGFPYVADVIAQLRQSETNPLVIHAGDFFQGTLYFTKYLGNADVAFWNLVKPDAATLGNHEFDKGSQVLHDTLLTKANFTIVDANVDMSHDAILRSVAPAAYKVLTVGKSKVGVIGATTIETPFISSPSKETNFIEPAIAVQKAADALTRSGVNKIVLISHLGYDVDLKLAPMLRGVDVIVGGHSHSLLGDWKADNLSSLGAYPTSAKDKDGNTTLVVQSWEWAKVVGDLGVDFDAKGKVIGYDAKPRLVAGSNFFQVYDLPDAAGTLSRVRWQWSGYNLGITLYDGKDWQEAPKDSLAYWTEQYTKLQAALAKHPEIILSAGDPAAWNLARGYAQGVVDLQRTVVGQVGEDLKRSLNAGPGPIVADAMRAWTKSQIGLTNAGGIRIDLLAGPLTTAKVYEVIPFGNTLVTLKATGDQVRKIFEDAADFALSHYGNEFPANPVTYVSGAKFSLHPSAARGSRVTDLQIMQADGSYVAAEPAATYSMVVNNFIAAGGDKYSTLAAIPDKQDTGYIDAETFFAYVAGKSLVNTEERIHIVK